MSSQETYEEVESMGESEDVVDVAPESEEDRGKSEEEPNEESGDLSEELETEDTVDEDTETSQETSEATESYPEHYSEVDDATLGGLPLSMEGVRAAALPRTMELMVEGGQIFYYSRRLNKKAKFIAQCRRHGSKCKKSRQAEAGREKSTGRPLGYMLCWLADHDLWDTFEEHRDEDVYDRAERLAAREALEEVALDDPLAEEFLKCERPLRANENKEPREQPR